MGAMEREIKVGRERMIVSRTDLRGIIEYANHDFSDVSGYALNELVNKPHNIVRHPDMPSVIFKWMWERLKNEEDIFAVVKNQAKNGDYYWVTTKFDIKRHPYEQQVTGYVAYRQGAAEELVKEIIPLYADLLAIEKSEGIEASERYFTGLLETKRLTYDAYIEEIVGQGGGGFKSFFKKMANIFS